MSVVESSEREVALAFSDTAQTAPKPMPQSTMPARTIEKPKRFRIPRIAKEINLLVVGEQLVVVCGNTQTVLEMVCGLLENRKTTDLRGLLEKGKKAR